LIIGSAVSHAHHSLHKLLIEDVNEDRRRDLRAFGSGQRRGEHAVDDDRVWRMALNLLAEPRADYRVRRL
jgi:hypothetical protein